MAVPKELPPCDGTRLVRRRRQLPWAALARHPPLVAPKMRGGEAGKMLCSRRKGWEFRAKDVRPKDKAADEA